MTVCNLYLIQRHCHHPKKPKHKQLMSLVQRKRTDSLFKKERLRLCSLELRKESIFREMSSISLLMGHVSTITLFTSTCQLGVDLDSNLSLLSHFDWTHKKAPGIANLSRSIRSSLDQKCAETIYKTMILPIFTYCGWLGLGWSDTQKSLINLRTLNNEVWKYW